MAATFKVKLQVTESKQKEKGKTLLSLTPYVKLLFSANDIPGRMKDKTGAVLRRLVIIPFNARFTKYLPSGEIGPGLQPLYQVSVG